MLFPFINSAAKIYILVIKEILYFCKKFIIMFCPHCGNEVSEQAVVCVKCGAALDSVAPTTPQPIQTERTPPDNWLVKSILATIFCCWPFSIAGIINAAKVNHLFAMGDIEGAEEAARNAKKWTKISFFVGISCWLLYVIIYAITIFILKKY
jgi:hypothetical protein